MPRDLSPSATPATQSTAASRATNGDQARHQTQPSAISATLPRQTKVDVTKRHACHAKRRWMSPRPTPATQRECGYLKVPCPRCNYSMDVTKCYACHATKAWMSPSATPAMQSAAAPPATSGAQACHRSQPSATSAMPRTQSVDVWKCHACRGITGDQWRPSAPPEPAQCHKCHACHAKRMWMSPSAKGFSV